MESFTITPLHGSDSHRLPSPTAARWKLLRLGIQNLWEYDVTTRLVALDGRLLLRGHNESGKTKAMELTVPAVFDAILRPERLDPFGEQSRLMRANLIGPHTPDHQKIVIGYAWAEFGRLDDAETPRFVTLGYGVRASRAASGHSAWFFRSDLRVDVDIHLFRDGQPLSAIQLEEALAGRGRVFVDDHDGYRHEVNRSLFGLADFRQFDKLMNLLLELRKPGLGKRLKAEDLSDMLSSSLPGLDLELLANVADGFNRLEEHRAQLDQLKDTRATLMHFNTAYRRYLQGVVAVAAAGIRSAETQVDSASVRLRDVTRELDHVIAELEQTQLTKRELGEAIGVLEARLETLKATEAFRDPERAGAPLYLLAGFRPNVAPEVQVAVEAGLQDAGLLDAWVTPDGEVRPVAGDITLRPASAELDEACTLLAVLEPVATAGVSLEVARRALATIAYGPGASDEPGDAAAWVSADGRWQAGRVIGRHGKDAVAYVGEEARRQARERRLTELGALLVEAEREVADLSADASRLEGRISAADDDLTAFPTLQPVIQARAAATVANDRARKSSAEATEAARALTAQRGRADTVTYGRDQVAVRVGLTLWAGRLGDLRGLVAGYEQAAGRWLAAAQVAEQASRRVQDAEEALAAARERLHDAEEELAERRRARAGADERVRTLIELIGADGQQIVAQVREAENRLAEARQGLHAATQSEVGLAGRRGAAQQNLKTTQERHQEARDLRTRAALRFQQLAAAGLVTEAVDLLRSTPGVHAGRDAALREFLHQRLEAARASEDAASLAGRLADVLDYRQWHRFVVKQRKGDDQQWSPLTRRVHGEGSGGSKSATLHLPLFAAAAAFYASADRLAPRLIALDEAFAGIDDQTTAKLLDLTVEWDFDLVMTGWREWMCFPEVPGLSIYEIVRDKDAHVVDTEWWTWDGRVCRAMAS